MKNALIILTTLFAFNANACMPEKLNINPIVLDNANHSVTVNYGNAKPSIFSTYTDYKIYDGFVNLGVEPVAVNDIRVERIKEEYPQYKDKQFYEYDYASKIKMAISGDRSIEAKANGNVIIINLKQNEMSIMKSMNTQGCSGYSDISYN